MSSPVADGVRYREPARGYRSLLYTVAALAVGFGIDLAVSVHGAVTHLPGWLGFGAVLVAIQTLILHAARSTHSLQVTDDEVSVGDEVLALDSIGGVVGEGSSTPADRDEPRPVLGWPGGAPRGIGSLVLRLSSGTQVEVPTRFPERLRTALGVGDSPEHDPYVVREATAADLPLLPDIDARAETIFRVAGFDVPAIELDISPTASVLVAGDPPVGFAAVEDMDGVAHLAALAVLPGAMRRGVGTRLLAAACDGAAERGLAAVTLTTYADVPWNAAFYRARGFADWAEPGPELRALCEREVAAGLDDAGRRVVLRRRLQ